MTQVTQTDSLPALGFIGLGVMGRHMATHLSRAGYRVSLYDIDHAAAQQLAGSLEHALAATSPAEVARHSNIIVTMLPNGQVVQQVVLGPEGLLAGLQPGSLLLDTSSSEPWITEQTAAALAKQGCGMVDAPVSGAQWGAEAAELVFMVGGSQKDVERVRPLLECMGRATFHLGGLGAGHSMKSLNNMITAMNLLALSEGLAIGTKLGLDPAVMTDVLLQSTGGSWVCQTHVRQRVLNRSFDDPFKLELMLKDIGIGMDLATRQQLPAPFSGTGQQLWRAASLAAGPGASVSELVRWVEKLTGTDIVSASEPPPAHPAAVHTTTP